MKKKSFFIECIMDFLEHSIISDKKLLLIGGSIREKAARLRPSYSVELFDAKDDPIVLSQQNCPNINYSNSRITDFKTDELFDYIIFYSNLSFEDDLYNIFGKLKELMHSDSKVFIIEINPFILFILKFLQRLGLAVPRLERNMLHLDDLQNLINIFGFDILDKGYRFASPFKLFGLGGAINAILPRIKFLRHLCFGQYITFRLHPTENKRQDLSCSVVIPCFNEEGNIKECISRIPDFGSFREIIIVNDGSKDNTEGIIREMMKDRSDIRLISYKENRGKGYAVNMGWQESKGDVLMMLDCDCTTAPEELVLFHNAMELGAEFINGTRVIYPREKNSIPYLNRLGVSFFARLISWITQKRITDTFCGTKVFLRKHRHCFQIKEYLWGDWDLFFAAARYRMKMLELPVHYKTRKYGETKMRPIKHGLILFFKSMEGLKVIK